MCTERLSYFFNLLFCLVLLYTTSAVAEEADETMSSLETVAAKTVSVKRERVLDGVIEAIHRATLTAQTSGRVIEINYDVDDYVKKGAVLLRFRDKDQRARYDGALANSVQAKSEYKRIKDLYKKNLLSKSAMDKAEANLIATRSARDQAKENLEHTLVRAPYSGIVVQRHIEVGETARVGRKLFTGLSLEQLRVSVNVPEDLINQIRENKQARIIIERDNSTSVMGQSLTISAIADPVSHTFVVRVNLPVGEYRIYPGMFAKVAFALGDETKLVVPQSSIVYRSEVRAVYVLDETNKIYFRQVRLGRALGSEQRIILAGLDEAEKIAVNPVKAAISLKEQRSGE
jgi:RND family efflux transporter MFP subunit